MLKRRESLSESARKGAAAGLFQEVIQSDLMEHHQHIAFYWPSRGEMDTSPLLDKAVALGKDCYLPVLDYDGDNWLHFAPFHFRSELKNNRYGIPEPLHSPEQLKPAAELDLVFVPLVSFDSKGNRMGMGKGYYDRTFEFLRAPRSTPGPLLVGLGYEFQHSEKLVPQPWDVPLAMAFTEARYFDFRRG